jgi:superfamily II DNA or RNA helicase
VLVNFHRSIEHRRMSDFATLQEMLALEEWRDRFDEDVLMAARKISKERRIGDLAAEVIDARNLTVTATCRDTPPARVEINFWQEHDDWELDTTCCCDLTYFCQHAAAALQSLSLQENLLRLIEGRTAAIKNPLEMAKASALLPQATADVPTLVTTPSFRLDVCREPVRDRSAAMICQYLGEKEPVEWVFARAVALYGTHELPLFSSHPEQERRGTDAAGQAILIRRERGSETLAALALRQIGLSAFDSTPMLRFLHGAQKRNLPDDNPWLPALPPSAAASYWHQFRAFHLGTLQTLGWEVTFTDNVGHEVYDALPDDWQTSLHKVDGDAGWFSLSVGFTVQGKPYDLLPILAKLIEDDYLEATLDRPDNGFVLAPLPDGAALKLPLGRVRAILKHLVALIDPQYTGKVHLHALDAVALSAVEELGLDTPPSLVELRAKMHDFSGIEETPAPQGLQATMRGYQITGFRWMQFLARHGLHGILADDMGLGKTMQTLAHLLTEKESGASKGLPSLVIAPTSVVSNWRAEALKFAPSLRLLVLGGADRGKYFRSMPYADVVLTSYALLHRDIEKLKAQPFHLVILDEAQYIKNPRAQVAQAACKLQARHRLCLSGTPVENHLGELWSLMRFLMPGFLGSEKSFNSRFRKAIEKQGDETRFEALKRRVAPLILRRTKDQVAKELPPKTILVHLIELSTPQKDLYETIRATMDKRVREAIAARGIEQSQILFLDALLKLRQLCCHPTLLPTEFSHHITESAKLNFLTELLSTLLEEGRRILLFSQFTSMLAIIERHLRQQGIPYLILTGSSKDRGALVEQFQSGKVPLFLISLKAGGTGLNLTAADTVIHYDPWWNPAAEAQATDRAYRIGQDKPVFVHKLLCENTVEQRIHLLQQEKAELANNLLSQADRSARLDPATLRNLLAPLE